MDQGLGPGESTSVPPQPPADSENNFFVDLDLDAIRTREEFADKSGYSRGTIHNYFHGKTLPQEREAVADILAILGATPDEVTAMQQALDRAAKPSRTASSTTQPRRAAILAYLRRRWLVVCAVATLVLAAVAGVIMWQRQAAPEQSEARLPTCADVGVFADGIDAYRWNREVWTDAYEAAGGRAVLGCPVRTADGFDHWWDRGMSQDLQDRRGKQTRLMALDRDHVIVMSGQYWTDYTNLHRKLAADLQGYPITDPVSCGNAKVVLLDKGDYTPGAMVTSSSGTYIWLPRPVWHEHQAMGGPQGPLGRPLNALNSTIRGTIAFEHDRHARQRHRASPK
jgi:AcrR family transcriptional regulator